MHKYHQAIVDQAKINLEGSEPILGIPEHIQGLMFFENGKCYEYLRKRKETNWKIEIK